MTLAPKARPVVMCFSFLGTLWCSVRFYFVVVVGVVVEDKAGDFLCFSKANKPCKKTKTNNEQILLVQR